MTGDTVYSGDTKLRIWLEERLQPNVLAVPKNQRIGLTRRATDDSSQDKEGNRQTISLDKPSSA